jgi:hypothetical protein
MRTVPARNFGDRHHNLEIISDQAALCTLEFQGYGTCPEIIRINMRTWFDTGSGNGNA